MKLVFLVQFKYICVSQPTESTSERWEKQKRMRGEVEFIDFMLAWSDNRHFDSRLIIKLGNVSEFLLHGLAWQRKENQ